MRNCKGFSVIELVITIVIVGLLSIVVVNVYANFSRKAKMSEGHALIGSVSRSEKMFYSEKGTLIAVDKTSYSQPLDIDVRSNKYYRHFYVFIPGIDYNADYTVVAVSEDDSVKEYAVVLHGYVHGSSISEIENIANGSGGKVLAKLNSINSGNSATTDPSVSNDSNNDDNDYFYGNIDQDDASGDNFTDTGNVNESNSEDTSSSNGNGNYGNGNNNGNNGNGNCGNGNNNGNHYGNGGIDNNGNDQNNWHNTNNG